MTEPEDSTVAVSLTGTGDGSGTVVTKLVPIPRAAVDCVLVDLLPGPG